MNRKMVVGLAVVVLVLLAGCASSASTGSKKNIETGELYSMYFEGDSVVCHPYAWGEAGGMDCYRVSPSNVSRNSTIVPPSQESVSFDGGKIVRVEYPRENRICYVYSWGESGGVDCVKMKPSS